MKTRVSPNTWTLGLILLSVCGLNVNNYFATSDQYEIVYKLSSGQFGTLFTIYSLPNVVLVFFSGLVIDKYGIIASSLLFNSLLMIGLIICALAPIPSDHMSSNSTYYVLLLGRLFIGLGGESIVACASTMIAKWFTYNGYINTAMSVNQAAVQLFGSSAAFFILPCFGIVVAQWIAVMVGILSCLFNVLYIVLELRYEDYLSEINGVIVENMNGETAQLINGGDERATASISSIENNDRYGAVELERISMAAIPVTHEISLISTFHILMDFPLIYWLLLLHVSCFSPILYTFTAFGPIYLLDNFQSISNIQEASMGISLLYMGIVCAPVSGIIIDYIGHRVLIQLFTSINILIVFLVLKYSLLWAHPYVYLIYLGILFSITETNSFALISYFVSHERLGAAYGLCACGISVALIFEPMAVGYFREYSQSFASSLWLFIVQLVLGIVFCAGMYAAQKWNQLVF